MDPSEPIAPRAKSHIGFQIRWINAAYVTLLGVMAVLMTVAHAKHVYNVYHDKQHAHSGCHVPGLMLHSGSSAPLTTHGVRDSEDALADTGSVTPGSGQTDPGEAGDITPGKDTPGLMRDCFTFEVEGWVIQGPTGLDSIFCLIFAPFGVCLVLILYLGAILDAICANEWVRERANFKLCLSRKCKWYQVGCHFRKLFCLYVQFIKWILQLICEYKQIFLFINYMLCAAAWAPAIVYIIFGTLI